MSSTSIWAKCLDAVQVVIRGLELTGLESADVVVRKLPWNRQPLDDGVFIHPVVERYGQGTNAREDVGYGVMVTMVRASNQNLTSNLDAFLLWRQLISAALRHKPSTLAVTGVYDVIIEPAAVYLPDAFLKNYDVGAILVRCLSRES